ncbi:electron transfer flavoprotein regulatory factor 1-like [Oppia nitens]|uniref:electron transfer flavoprotein regulatory factor 1-like n=1 Tax=Oppia nitens TaxID=1686743 RepID=UPI0023DB304B|nr:electron transfer flavoprotein regulatory factor 1-like [Oppia nitens]
MNQRLRVLNLYKTLLYMGRDYPLGYKYFRDRCHRAFAKNQSETNTETIDQMIKRGEFVVKEIEALYRLKKYRTMKKRYYPEDDKQQLLSIDDSTGSTIDSDGQRPVSGDSKT